MNTTPPRGRQLLPTQPEQRAYLKSIREAADRGDLSAMASALFLVKLSEQIDALERARVSASKAELFNDRTS
ncbi:hypothetical protein L3X16_11120 [Pseudomonas stutzeri]|nr:hypothetical protein [Stutzerimonas stutzeri]